jgi:hypothetical protein
VGKRRGAVPASYDARVSTEDNVMQRSNFAAANLLAAVHVGRSLNGEKLSDLPVMLSAKLEFVSNPKTAGRTARVRSSDASNGQGQRRGNSKSLPAMPAKLEPLFPIP